MAEEKGIVKYQARDGQEITLGFEIVRQYLVHGKRELVTPQELMFFMGVCKSRGLNPFKRDAYLIKYSEDPAAIVTSIDFYRSRARAQTDCKGWKAGITIQKNSAVENREGALLLDGEKLVGGWFEAKPDGWDKPRFHSISLKGYIKKKRDGSITKFWEEDNQPSQIMKVAEAQGLRMIWPDQFQQLYSEEEILSPMPGVDGTMAEAGEEKIRQEGIQKFRDFALNQEQLFKGSLDEFLAITAQANRSSIDEVMVAAAKDEANLKSFWDAYRKWEAKQKNAGEKPDANPKQAPNIAQGASIPQKEEQAPSAGEGKGRYGDKTAEEAPEGQLFYRPPEQEKPKSPTERVRNLERTDPCLFKAACDAADIAYPMSEPASILILQKANEIYRKMNGKEKK